ncbi:MAG: molybdopterin cofactor-binding domain-containing protein, partial [Actinomycetota bacterium]
AGETTTIEGDRVCLDGRPVADLAGLLDEPVVATRTFRHRPTTPMDGKGQGDLHPMFAFAAMRAVVDVDRDLGLVRVVHLASAVDVGTAVNPQLVEGQSEGGAAMGLGLAVMEEIQVREGVIRNPSFTDYLLPTILDVPSVDTVIVEEPEPGAPFGVKGVGESATIVALPAIVAAIRDATGLELNRAPVRPDDAAGLTGAVTTEGWPPVPDVPGQEPVPTYGGALLSQRATGGGEEP